MVYLVKHWVKECASSFVNRNWMMASANNDNNNNWDLYSALSSWSARALYSAEILKVKNIHKPRKLDAKHQIWASKPDFIKTLLEHEQRIDCLRKRLESDICCNI